MIVILDWDKTITKSDTTALIAPAEGTQRFGRGFSNYEDEYEALCREQTANFGRRNTLERELAYLGSMGFVEDTIRSRVESEGLFKQSKEEGFDRVEFVAGWKEACGWFREQQVLELHILSCSWSGSFIETCLASDDFQGLVLKSVRCNEIDRIEGRFRASAGCRKVLNGVRTGLDKLEEMDDIVEGCQSRKVVYVGDSSTDLGCLLKADIGIIMGSNETLAAVCERLNLITLRATETTPSTFTRGKVLVKAQDWYEVLDLLKKC
ncbi:hypothetical protein CROQUDRAFT_656800 [Cronartium quercuum f. sp. fusiforme G11]|uniref:Haloacid dehalogenase-like hydrolase n=1 Tax=Cronartium quercuum f. sp. fusiforme G11 TaxID=708437 RepID=A0A9P6NMF5_9BASI|nr:hypothetical protein CROQUDRAFT_656800 [Cronartium quercuum f. sp. fusiforme G11]